MSGSTGPAREVHRRAVEVVEDLDEVREDAAEGYKAMDERRAIKVLLTV